MLKEDFIPVAFDQWYQRRQDDAEGKFYQQIATQSPRNDMDITTQGFFIATGGGELLYYNNNRGPDRIRDLMKTSLAMKRTWTAEPLPLDQTLDDRFQHNIPEGAIVIQVNSKVLDGYGKPANHFKRIMHNSIGRDNMWIMPEEAAALRNGEPIPRSLIKRICLFHLNDNTRGEPKMWSEEELVQHEFAIDSNNGRFTAKIHLMTADKLLSYKADILGFVEFDGDTMTRFDMVAGGQHRGEGKWTSGAPESEFPVAIAFRIADKDDVAYPVRPQAMKAIGKGYLKLAR